MVGSVGAGVVGSVGESGYVGGWCQNMVVVGCGVYVGNGDGVSKERSRGGFSGSPLGSFIGF